MYEISNLGRVKSKYKELRILKWNVGSNGYATVELFKAKKSKRLLVHRLVAISFIDNPNDLPQVNHIDENKLNNCVDNLEWRTSQYNMTYNNMQSRRVKNARWFYDKLSEQFKKNNPAIKIPVVQMTLNDEEIKTWESAVFASKKLGFNPAHISECCKHKRKTSNGFKWKYKEET